MLGISFLKNTFVYGASLATSKGILFLSIPVFTALFTVEEYGLISFVMSSVGVAAIFMQCGSNNAVQRFYFDADASSQPVIIMSGLFLLLFSSLAVLFFCLVLINVLPDSILKERGISETVFYLAIFYIFLYQYIIFSKDLMRLHFKPWIYAYFDVLPVLLGVLLAALFVGEFDLGLEGYFLGLLIGAVLVIISILFVKQIRIKVGLKVSCVKQLFDYGYPFVFVALAYWVFQSSDLWLILTLSDSTQLGYYSIASQFSFLMMFLVTLFGVVWSPYSMRILSENKAHKKVYSIVANILYLTLVSIAIFFTFFVDELLLFMVGEEYYPARVIIPVLFFTVVFLGTTQVTLLGISIAKKTKILPYLSWLVALLNIVLNFIMIPLYGALGAAVATLICNFILTILYFIVSQRSYLIPYQMSKIVVLTMSLFGFLFSYYFFELHGLSLFVKFGFCSVVVFVYGLWLSKELEALKPYLSSYKEI